MTMPDYPIRVESSWVAYYLGQGLSPEDIEQKWLKRFPSLPIARFQVALDYAYEMSRVGTNVANLGANAKLKRALGRIEPPDELVTVSVLAHWTDAQGHDYYNTLKVQATWDWTKQQVLYEAAAALGEITDRYPGSKFGGMEIIPMVLWPSGEVL